MESSRRPSLTYGEPDAGKLARPVRERGPGKPARSNPVPAPGADAHTKKLWGCRRVKSGVMWTSPNGLTRITRAGPCPANLAPTLDRELVEPDTGGWIHAEDLEKELDHPTWWESNIGSDIAGPTLNDVALANDPVQHKTLRSLRRLYMQHLQVEALRDKLEPPPF